MYKPEERKEKEHKGFSSIVMILIVLSVSTIGLTWYQVSNIGDRTVGLREDTGVRDAVLSANNIQKFLEESFRTASREGIRDTALKGGRSEELGGSHYVCQGNENIPDKSDITSTFEAEALGHLRNRVDRVNYISGVDVSGISGFFLDTTDIYLESFYDENLTAKANFGDFEVTDEDTGTSIEVKGFEASESIENTRAKYLHSRIEEFFDSEDRVEEFKEASLLSIYHNAPTMHRHEFEDTGTLMLSEPGAEMICFMRSQDKDMYINEEHYNWISEAIGVAQDYFASEVESFIDDDDVDCYASYSYVDTDLDDSEFDWTTDSGRRYPGLEIYGMYDPHQPEVDVTCIDPPVIPEVCGGGSVGGDMIEPLIPDWVPSRVVTAIIDYIFENLGGEGCQTIDRHLGFRVNADFRVTCTDNKYNTVPSSSERSGVIGFDSGEMEGVSWRFKFHSTFDEEVFSMDAEPGDGDGHFYSPTYEDDYLIRRGDNFMDYREGPYDVTECH